MNVGMRKSRCAVAGAVVLLMTVLGCQTEKVVKPDEVNFPALLRDAVAEQRQMMQTYVREQKFGASLPKLQGAQLARFMPAALTESQRAEIKNAVAEEFNRDKTEIVYPGWIKFRCDNLETVVVDSMATAGKFAATNEFDRVRATFDDVREKLWNVADEAVLDGNPVPEVNVPVHACAIRLLVEKVNVVHWSIIESEMCKIADDSVLAAKPEDGVKALNDFPWIRAYTQNLDKHVSGIAAELSRQGIPAPATEAIRLATHDFMCEAAKLADRVDEVDHSKKLLKNGRPAPDDSRFRKLLEEYRVALLKYGCTEENAKCLTEWMGKKAAELYEDLPPKTEDVFGTVTTTVKLGTTALNTRIANLRGRLVARLNIEIAKNEKMRKELEDMLKRDPKAARDRVVALLTGAAEAGESERAMAKYELLTRINPELWFAIRKEISAKVEEFIKSGKCSEGIAWIQAYPRVRTYPQEIDDQYKKVCAAAIDMGVPKDKAEMIIDRIAATTADVEYLFCDDDYEKPGVKPGVVIPKDKVAAYEKAVAHCRLVLVRNGCKVDNAETLIDMIHTAYSNETRKIESTVSAPVLYLGANAINQHLEILKKNAALGLLSRYAASRLDANDADGARRTIRSIALTGDADFDAEVYAIRLGVINALVNPCQLNMLKRNVEAKVSEFCKAEDYIGLKKWITEYPFVHDRSEDVARSLQAIRKGMQALKVDKEKAADSIDRLDRTIQELVDGATGGREPEIHYQEMAWLERELSVLERAILQQYYTNLCAKICRDARAELVSLVEKPHGATVTTRELNAQLSATMESCARKQIAATLSKRPKFRILPDPTEAEVVQNVLVEAARKGFVAQVANKSKNEILAEMSGGVTDDVVAWVMKLCDDIVRGRDCVAQDAVPSMEFVQLLDRLIERQRYLEYLLAADRSIGYDSQISMAEDAIAKQLDAEPDETCLRVNALLGEYARAMRFLKQGMKLDGRLGAAMLIGAVCLDQESVVDTALELGVPVDAVCPMDPDGRTALLMAIQLGRGNLIHKIAARGGSAKSVDACGNTVLHYAACRGNASVLKAFLSQQDVNATNNVGETAVFVAARVNSAKCVEALVATNANVNISNAHGMNVMDVACQAGSCDVLDPLASAGAAFGVKQLVTAVSAGQLGAVKWLVGKGIDVNGTGVMAASVPHQLVRDYLIREGGIGKRFVVVESTAIATNDTANVKMNLEIESARLKVVPVEKR